MTGNKLRRELKKIGDRNRRFNKMTPEKQRVTIAKDVIKALNTKIIVAKHGCGYAQGKLLDNGDKLPKGYKCGVCALGGMFVGLTTRIKNLSVKNTDTDRPSLTSPLRAYFTEYQLDAIEYAFEEGAVSSRSLVWDFAVACKAFGHKYSEPYERLVAIMKNIISNNGEFNP